MKKLLLGAVAALAVSAPGLASAQSGYIDLSYQSTEADVAGVDVEGEGWTVGGAAAFGGNGSLGFQVDALFSTSDDSDTDAWSLGGHVFNRNDRRLVGGFLNYGSSDDGTNDYDQWTVGLEGQFYLDRTTVDGALSYSEADDFDASLIALDLGLTAFQSDNFSVGANVGFGILDDGSDDTNVLTLGAGAEWQPGSMPFSIFAGYQHAEIDDLNADSDTFGVGVRYNFGGTLFERNRSGASLARGGGLGRFNGLL